MRQFWERPVRRGDEIMAVERIVSPQLTSGQTFFRPAQAIPSRPVNGRQAGRGEPMHGAGPAMPPVDHGGGGVWRRARGCFFARRPHRSKNTPPPGPPPNTPRPCPGRETPDPPPPPPPPVPS